MTQKEQPLPIDRKHGRMPLAHNAHIAAHSCDLDALLHLFLQMRGIRRGGVLAAVGPGAVRVRNALRIGRPGDVVDVLPVVFGVVSYAARLLRGDATQTLRLPSSSTNHATRFFAGAAVS